MCVCVLFCWFLWVYVGGWVGGWGIQSSAATGQQKFCFGSPKFEYTWPCRSAERSRPPNDYFPKLALLGFVDRAPLKFQAV